MPKNLEEDTFPDSVAILDFPGDSALQALSECPFCC